MHIIFWSCLNILSGVNAVQCTCQYLTPYNSLQPNGEVNNLNHTGINPFLNKSFLRVCNTSFFNTLCEKEKLLVTSNFSFSHSVFYPFGELTTIFMKFKIVVCKLSVWKSLKYVVWERVESDIS